MPDNNGILLYQSGKLINRHECDFGNLLSQKFYQKKYLNKPNNIFNVVGEIHFTKQIKLINFKTAVQINSNYLCFL